MFVLVPPSPVHFVPCLREIVESFADEAPSRGEVNAVYESGDAPPNGAPFGGGVAPRGGARRLMEGSGTSRGS